MNSAVNLILFGISVIPWMLTTNTAEGNMPNEYIQVRTDFLWKVLRQMESDWRQIDAEWGSCRGDSAVDEAIEAGIAPEIEELRRLLGVETPRAKKPELAYP